MKDVWKRLMQSLAKPNDGFDTPDGNHGIVYGARRPGFPFPFVPDEIVSQWLDYMESHSIQRVVCLLPPSQLSGYKDLLGMYRTRFGVPNVCWAPIEDFKLASESILVGTILPFLHDSNHRHLKTVVHCAGGIGRTGHVLAAWLVSGRGYTNEAAILAVKQNGRNARESGDPRLDELLNLCRRKF